MLRQEHVNTLRQTHRTVTTMLPLVTAALTVTGALIASMDHSGGQRGAHDGADNGAATGQSRRPASGLFGSAFGAGQSSGYAPSSDQTPDDDHEFSALAYAQTLVSRVLLVAIGFALVGSLALIALRVGSVGVAIELTALILLVFYLAEKVTRRARRQARLIRRGPATTPADPIRQ